MEVLEISWGGVVIMEVVATSAEVSVICILGKSASGLIRTNAGTLDIDMAVSLSPDFGFLCCWKNN